MATRAPKSRPEESRRWQLARQVAAWASLLLVAGGLSFHRCNATEERRAMAPVEPARQELRANLPPTPTPQPQLPGPVIRGDVRAVSGHGLAGAQVCLQNAVDVAPDRACAVSDASGRFSIAVTSGQETWLLASLAGYLPSRQLAYPGQETPVVLQPGGAQLSGTVLDASGGVIAGAIVSARGDRDFPLALTSSGNAGEFRLSVPPETVVLQVRATAYSETSVRVHPPAQGLRIVLARASEVAGIVTTALTGEPLANVTVTAINQSDWREERRHVSTDDQGRFHLSGLAGGRYELVGVAPSWRTTAVPVNIAVGERLEGVLLTASRGVQLRVSVDVEDEPCLRGVVRLSGASEAVGMIADGAGELDGLLPGRYLAMVSCSATHRHAQESQGLEEELVIEEPSVTRRWRLAVASPDPGAKAGTVRVTIGARDARALTAVLFEPRSSTLIRGELDGTATVFRDVPLGSYQALITQAPEVTAGVELSQQGQAVSVQLDAPQSSTTIAGVVLDEAGGPVPDAWVRLSRSTFVDIEFAPAGAPALTNADGEFVITDLFAGTYDIDVETPMGRARATQVSGGSQNVKLALSSYGSISAKLQSASGERQPCASVSFRRNGGRLQRMPCRDGVGNLQWMLPGTYDVRLESEVGGAGATVTVGAGEAVEVTSTVRGS